MSKRGRESRPWLPMRELEIPTKHLRAGALGHKKAVQEALTEAIKKSFLSREEIAQELTRLTGHQVSVHQINNWTGESRNDRHIPLEHLSALVALLGAPEIAQAALDGCGMAVLSEEDYRYYELGKIVAEDKARSKKKKKIMEDLKI